MSKKPTKKRKTAAPVKTAPVDAPEDMEMSKDLTQYIDTKTTSEMLGSTQDHVNHLLKQKKIKGIKIGSRWLVYKPSVEKYSPPKSAGGRPRSGTPQPQTDA